MTSRFDPWELLSRWSTTLAFGLAVVAILVSPLLAIGWTQLPFPGFMLDPTLVVDSATRPGWFGTQIGLTYPQQVLRMGGQPVRSADDVRQVVSGLSPGATVPVFVRFPDGSQVLYPQVPLVEFTTEDLLAIFWLPYLVGLAYLGIGYWLYRVTGHSRPGRALSFFCACTAVTSGLVFDLWTTHALPGLMALALALTGGALVSLSLRFPQEWRPVERRPWLLGLPYGISLGLAVLNWVALRDTANPWRIYLVWRAIYLHAALAVIFFLGLTAYRGGASRSPLVRRQARIVLAGSLMAFAPVTFWFLSPAFDLQLNFQPSVFLPSLLLFPVAVGLAILRYRLWQMDTLVNKAVVYGILTAVLAGVFTALIGLSQRVFVVMTGERSDAALILTTLIVAAAATPIRSWVQEFVDRRFRETPATSTRLTAFGQQVQVFVEMNDPQRLARRLLQESISALGAVSGSLRLKVDGQEEVVHTVGPWRGEAIASVPLVSGPRRIGLLQLGPRQDSSGYSAGEIRAVQAAAEQVAEALQLSITGRPAGA